MSTLRKPKAETGQDWMSEAWYIRGLKARYTTIIIRNPKNSIGNLGPCSIQLLQMVEVST